MSLKSRIERYQIKREAEKSRRRVGDLVNEGLLGQRAVVSQMYSQPVREAFGLQLRLLVENDPSVAKRLEADLDQIRENMGVEQLAAFSEQVAQLALDVISGLPEGRR